MTAIGLSASFTLPAPWLSMSIAIAIAHLTTVQPRTKAIRKCFAQLHGVRGEVFAPGAICLRSHKIKRTQLDRPKYNENLKNSTFNAPVKD